MEGGKENQQARRGRNRRACLETVLGRPGDRHAEGRGSRGRALQRVRSTNRSSCWGAGNESLRDGLCLETQMAWFSAPFPNRITPGHGIWAVPHLHMWQPMLAQKRVSPWAMYHPTFCQQDADKIYY